jgi:hypothetical protein
VPVEKHRSGQPEVEPCTFRMIKSKTVEGRGGGEGMNAMMRPWFHERRELLDQLNVYQLLKEDPVSLSS